MAEPDQSDVYQAVIQFVAFGKRFVAGSNALGSGG